MEEKKNYEKVDVNDVESILEAISAEQLPRKEEEVLEKVDQCKNELNEKIKEEENQINKEILEKEEERKEELFQERKTEKDEEIKHEAVQENFALHEENKVEEVKPQKNVSDTGKSYLIKEYKKGDIISVTVVKVEQNGVLVSAGTKEDVFIPGHGLSIKPINSPSEVVKVGDKIDVYVMRDSSSGGSLALSKKLADYQKKWDSLKARFVKREKVQGVPVKKIKGGLLVDIDGISAFLPQSQVGLRRGETLEEFINKPLDLYILEIDKSLKRIVVSRLKVLDEAKEEEKKKALVEIKKGEIYEGIVRSIQDFGVFIELNSGLEGLVRLNELTWGRRRPPHEVVKVGQRIKVKVLNVNLDNEKIALSIRQTKPYPWDVVDVKYPIDSIVEGQVIRIHDFGAVIEIEDGLTGLIHISQLDNKRVNKVEEAVHLGEIVKAKVISIDKENKKIKLSRKALLQEKEKEQ